MATISQHNFYFVGDEIVNYKTPLPNAGTMQLWSIVTIKSDSVYRVVQYATQIITTFGDGCKAFMRVRKADNLDFTQWEQWKQIAIAEPPDVIGSSFQYDRDQFGHLNIRCNAVHDGSFPIGYGQAMFYLPEGYRPKEPWYFTCTFWESAIYNGHVTARIDPDGRILLFPPSEIGGAIRIGFVLAGIPAL